MVPVHVEFQSSNGCNDVKYQSFNDSYDVGDDFDENGGITLMRKGGEDPEHWVGQPHNLPLRDHNRSK